MGILKLWYEEFLYFVDTEKESLQSQEPENKHWVHLSPVRASKDKPFQ